MSVKKHTNYSAEFKAKVAIELLEGEDPIGIVASRYDLNPTMLARWRRQFLENASMIFSAQSDEQKLLKEEEEHVKEVDNLNRIIGELTVERDYLQNVCTQLLEGKDLYDLVDITKQLSVAKQREFLHIPRSSYYAHCEKPNNNRLFTQEEERAMKETDLIHIGSPCYGAHKISKVAFHHIVLRQIL